jgi:parallel beta helix pectate lyase-like protein
MRRSFWLASFGIALALGAMTPAAQAQATRTWVSGVGNDADPCSRTAPCKTFAGAISKTAAGGEIDALDPGGFGTLTITKAITIDGGGGQVASVLASGTIGFNINAGTSDVVTLRNLRINGAGTTLGTKGINILNAGAVRVQKCVIENFSNVGIDAENAARTFLDVTDSVIQNNTVGGIFSSTAATGGGRNRISIDHTALLGNGYGVRASLNTRMDISESIISSSANTGVLADSSSTNLVITDSTVTNTIGTGIQSSNSAVIHISDVQVNKNNNGLAFTAGGQIVSWGNNHVADNPLGDGTPSSTIPPI